LEENLRLARHYLHHADELPAAWQDAAEFSTYALRVTPGELTELIAAIDALVAPLRGAVRPDPPEDAAEVRISIDAFRRTDLP
jgi:hypothetical protein